MEACQGRKSHTREGRLAVFMLTARTYMSAPGTCVDCGNEAYIRLAGETETMICAHCFAARKRPAKAPAAATPLLMQPRTRADVS